MSQSNYLSPQENPSVGEETLLRLVLSCTGETSVREIRKFITGNYEEIYARVKEGHSEYFQEFKNMRHTAKLKAIIGLRQRLDAKLNRGEAS